MDSTPYSKFELRTYTKMELAEMYCPDRVNPRSAMKTFNRWMHSAPRLLEELHAVGFNPRRHCFLKREVEIITKHLGDPL